MWQAPWTAPRTVPYRQEDPAAGLHQVVNKNPIHPTGRDRPDPAAIKIGRARPRRDQYRRLVNLQHLISHGSCKACQALWSRQDEAADGAMYLLAH